jgi:hypothetical protein
MHSNSERSTVFVMIFATFLAGGLVVVPALEIANADSNIQLLKNNKPKNSTHNGGGGNNPPNIGVNPLAFASLGYESGSFTGGWEWGESQAQSHDRLVTVDKTSIVSQNSGDPNGTQALKVTLHPTDVNSSGTRAEVVHRNPLPGMTDSRYKNGTEMWFHWYTLFPLNLTVPERFALWTQFHQDDNHVSMCRDPSQNGAPFNCTGNVLPLQFNLLRVNGQDTLRLLVINKTDVLKISDDPNANNSNGKGIGFDIVWNASLQKDVWYEFLLHIKWAKCGNGNITVDYDINGKCINNNGGVVELWADDGQTQTHVVTTNHFNMDDDGYAYLKQGLYQCNSIQCPNQPIHNIYHDGMEVAICPPSNPYYHPNTGKCFTT